MNTTLVYVSFTVQYFFLALICFWFGNFLTTFYYRIPRNIPINGRTHPPMCSSCGVRLKYPDYGPFYHHLFKGKTCKHCNAIIPTDYFWIELLAGLTMFAYFAIAGMSQYTIAGSMLIWNILLVIFLYHKNQQFYEKSIWLVCVSSIILFFLGFEERGTALLRICMQITATCSMVYLYEKFILKKLKKELALDSSVILLFSFMVLPLETPFALVNILIFLLLFSSRRKILRTAGFFTVILSIFLTSFMEMHGKKNPHQELVGQRITKTTIQVAEQAPRKPLK